MNKNTLQNTEKLEWINKILLLSLDESVCEEPNSEKLNELIQEFPFEKKVDAINQLLRFFNELYERANETINDYTECGDSFTLHDITTITQLLINLLDTIRLILTTYKFDFIKNKNLIYIDTDGVFSDEAGTCIKFNFIDIDDYALNESEEFRCKDECEVLGYDFYKTDSQIYYNIIKKWFTINQTTLTITYLAELIQILYNKSTNITPCNEENISELIYNLVNAIYLLDEIYNLDTLICNSTRTETRYSFDNEIFKKNMAFKQQAH